jgi:hypothetical protein
MTAVVTMRSAGAAFESRAAAGTATTLVGSTSSAMVAATIVSAAIVAIASTAAVRPLEASARIATDARGIAREILARFGSTGTWGACFAGEKDSVVIGGDRLRGGFGTRGLNRFSLTLFVNLGVTDCSRV